MSIQTKPSIVFAHGIWADGSCFNKVIRPLLAEGYEVIAAQYGLDSLESDVAALVRTLGRVSRPAILVGHSYGGSVITAAGTDDRVAGLVYIAALAPDETETSLSQVEQFPTPEVLSHVEVADGRLWLRPEGIACLPATYPRTSSTSSGRPTSRRQQIYSPRGSKARPGGPSRAGTSSRTTTAQSNPKWNASRPSA